ncbi:MAG: hypothetical protein QM655_10015 [Nocardioidaceae bacterium]
MSAAFLLDAGALFVTQAAVQSIVIASVAPTPHQALVRWTDAVIGGAVAVVAATVVPQAPLRRPAEQAARVVRKMAELLRGAARGITDGDVEVTLGVLRDARATDAMVRELRDASAEGLSLIAGSPFGRQHRTSVRQTADLIEPLDYAIRNTRILVRRVAVAAYRHEQIPASYARFCDDIAAAATEIAAELHAGRRPDAVRDRLLALGRATAQLEQTDELSAQVVLAQFRSVLADLLWITGMGAMESTDAIPPIDRR